VTGVTNEQAEARSSTKLTKEVQKMRKGRINWDHIPLGKMSDREVSKKYGISYSHVVETRNKKKIPAYVPRIDENKLKDLWHLSNTEIVAITGYSFASIGRWRDKLSKPRVRLLVYRSRRKRGIFAPINWEDVPLGLKPDTVIAQELNVSVATVSQQRKISGIKFKWQVPVDEVLAREMLRDHSNVEIQAKTNISNRQLKLLRKKLGIPSGYNQKINWDNINDTGELSAKSLALKHGLTKDSVFRRRKRMGIKCTAYTEMRADNAPKHIPEQRKCLACEKVFYTKSANQVYCSTYCSQCVEHELRRLNLKASEIENPTLVHMLFQISDKLVSGKTYIPWRKHLNELFVSTEAELTEKFGATHRNICVARLRLREKWEQLIKNEKNIKKGKE
jgi:hypothetical protein